MTPVPLLALACLLVSPAVVGAEQARPSPVIDLRARPVEYLGPGRETPPAAGLEELRIAFFGPADPAHREWGIAWRGALMAVEEANSDGASLPFHLLSAWSPNPWGAGVTDLAKLVFAEGAWAVVGGVDGATTHLAEQIAVKANLSIVSPGGTDPSVNFTSVPWMFTLLPTDDRIAPRLLEALAQGQEPWLAVTTTDRDAAAAWRLLIGSEARRNARAPLHHQVLPAGLPGYGPAVAELARSRARVALVLAEATDSARLVAALRQGGFAGRIVGGAACGRSVFAEQAGVAAEGVEFPLLFDAEGEPAAAFVRAFDARWGGRPDYLAAYAYDATRLVIAAIRLAGPNRARIRDALVELAPWTGVTGPVTWDLTGRNQRGVELGIWRNGRACPMRAGERVGR